MQERGQRAHLAALDGLRGIAATIVVLYHGSLVFEGGITAIVGFDPSRPDSLASWFGTFPISIAIAGPQAVILFFVLSGYVLTQAMIGHDRPAYRPYAVKRFFRIWPAFAVAIVCSALLSRFVGRHDVPGASAWFHAIWERGAKPGNIWRHLAMTETRVDLDNVMWSLVHELRISLLFPILLTVMRRHRWQTLAIGIALLFAACLIQPFTKPATVARSYVEMCSYIFLFCFGCAARLWLGEDGNVTCRGWARSAAMLVLALCLLLCGPKDTAHVGSLAEGGRLLMCGVGATAIVVLAIRSRFRTICANTFALYLGRISYSLYLIHVIVFAAMVNALADRIPVGVSVAGALAILFPAAHLFQRFIEAPTAQWGRVIAASFDRRSYCKRAGLGPG